MFVAVFLLKNKHADGQTFQNIIGVKDYSSLKIFNDTEVKMVFGLTDNFFNNAVIASECNERSNLPSLSSYLSFFSRKLNNSLKILLKLNKNRTCAWQIASLVALATNEQVCFSTILRHCTAFCQAKAVIARSAATKQSAKFRSLLVA